MDLKDCSAEALEVAVDFMYGIKVPARFTELCELLHLAELFMMENLSEIVVGRLAKELTTDNYLQVSQTAEMYNMENLIDKCATFIHDQLGNNVEWEKMGKLSKVMAAFGKVTMKKKKSSCAECMTMCPSNFETDKLYGDYVKSIVKNGSRVRARLDVINSGKTASVGSKGTVSIINDNQITVEFFGNDRIISFTGSEQVGQYLHLLA